MLKKMASVAFFVTLLLNSAGTLAADTQALENTNILIATSETPETKNEHAVALNSANAGETADAGTMSPSASAWILGLALLGFVLLSNRRAI